jgi:tetratricopeptide (TPR) repeat protein
MIAMSEEATEVAIRHHDFVLGLDEQTDDKELLAIANFWKSRCRCMKGEYDQALVYARKGRQLATLGNIHSSYGRIARRHGRYQLALAHFTAAIAQDRQRDPCHRNVPRTLSNLVSVKRLTRCTCAAKSMLTPPGVARLLLADARAQKMVRLRIAIVSSNFAARPWPYSMKPQEFTSRIGITTAWTVSI